MIPKMLPPRDLVRQLLDYDPSTGVLTWLPRPREMFSRPNEYGRWNQMFPGTVAGCAGAAKVSVCINDGRYMAHRLIWLLVHGEPVPPLIDHIDGNPHNNRIDNLRAATKSQNMVNSGRQKNNTSGIRGVQKAPNQRSGFAAYIRANGRHIHLGTFTTIEEAARTRQEAADKLHGEYARHE
jgi:hypothetical protein